MIELVVTGCGRSGTGYMSRLLTDIGVLCGHEYVFNARFIETQTYKPPIVGTYIADASWVAAGLLTECEDLLTVKWIWHQTRNPVRVIRSLMGTKQFDRDPPGRYADYVYHHFPEMVDMTPTERCMRYWVVWNKMTERLVSRYGYVRYRIEDMGDPSGVKLRDMLKFAGYECELSRIQDALASTSPLTNSRARDNAVTWDSLPDGDVKHLLAEEAVRSGYSVEEMENA